MIWNDGKPMDFWVPYQTKPFLRHQFWNKTSLCISRPGQCGNPPGHDLKDERISTSLETTWDFSTASHSLKVGRVLMFWGGDLQHSEFFRDNWIFSILAGLFFGRFWRWASDFTTEKNCPSRIYQLEEQNTEYRADLYDCMIHLFTS